MTRILTVFALVAAGFPALCRPVCGQEAPASPYSGENMPFFPAGEGAVLVYEDRDAEGSLLSFTTDSTVSVDGDFSRGRATVLSTVTVPEDTQRVATSVPMIFDGGEVITDVAALMQSSMQDMVLQSMAAAGSVGEDEEAAVAEVIGKMRVSGQCRGIPADISVGDELPDYGIEVKIMFLTTKMDVKDRRVTGRERIETPAGTFDCYVVEEELSVKAMMMNEKSSQKSWYARGVGLVRQESRTRKKLTGTSVLTECRNLGN